MFITYDYNIYNKYDIVKNFYHNNNITKIITITTIIIIIDIIIMSLLDFHLTKIEFIKLLGYWGICMSMHLHV